MNGFRQVLDRLHAWKERSSFTCGEEAHELGNILLGLECQLILMEPDPEAEMVRSIAALLRTHQGRDSYLNRVFAPWSYHYPNMKQMEGWTDEERVTAYALGSWKLAKGMGMPPPCESWDRKALAGVCGASIYRERPRYWLERNANLKNLDADDDPLFLPDVLSRDVLTSIAGTRVYWVCWRHAMMASGPTPGALPRIPADSVADAMAAADEALRVAGCWLAEEVG